MASCQALTAKPRRFLGAPSRWRKQSTLISGLGLLLTALALHAADATGVGEETLATAATPENPILHIGIVQRFGRSETDQVELAAPTGSLPSGHTAESGSVVAGCRRGWPTPAILAAGRSRC